jgi:hypothetical protein
MRNLIVALVAIVVMTSPAFAATDDSGGIGLTLAELEDLYGPAEIGQGLRYVTTEDGIQMNLGMDEDDQIVTSIQVFFPGEGEGAILLEDATALAESLLPTDVDLERSFEPPATGAGHPIMHSWLWDSDWLDDQVGSDQILVTMYVSGGLVEGEEGMQLIVQQLVISVGGEMQ